METFRLILDSTGNVTQDNYRPVQPRNSRNVYVNYQAYVCKCNHTASFSSLIASDIMHEEVTGIMAGIGGIWKCTALTNFFCGER